MSEEQSAEELSFEAARAELERIVQQLESGQVELEEALVLWQRGEALFMGSCWGIAARLLSLGKQSGLRASYVARTWLDKRGGNDSFMDRGLVHRCGIAVHGFTAIADTIFGAGSAEAR